MARIMLRDPPPNTPTMRMAVSRPGMASSTSVPAISTLSSHPRRYPARMPMALPAVTARTTAPSGTQMTTGIALTTLAARSLPSWSVPNQCRADGPWRESAGLIWIGSQWITSGPAMARISTGAISRRPNLPEGCLATARSWCQKRALRIPGTSPAPRLSTVERASGSERGVVMSVPAVSGRGWGRGGPR